MPGGTRIEAKPSESQVMKIESQCRAADQRAEIMRDLVTYWNGKLRGRRFPAKADMRPEELKRYLGNLCILEVVGEPPVFRYRLVGSRLTDATEHNATGHEARDIPPPEYGESIHRDLLQALEAAVPVVHEITLRRDGVKLSYQRATLPLAGDGEHIDHLMTFSLRPAAFTQLFRQIDASAVS